VVERSAVNLFQEHFRSSAFSLRDSLKMRCSEGKHRSKRAILHACHVSPKSNDPVSDASDNDFREREPYTHAHTHARCVSFVYSAWREAGGAALGL